MDSLLFLAHRIPYPPNKGDKIRSFNLLKYLSNHFRIFLGSFIDDERDRRYVKDVEAFCEEVCFVPLVPRLARLRSLSGMLRHEPLSLPYYRDKRMQCWVNALLDAGKADSILIFSSVMTQYVEKCLQHLTTVIDFVDVDSDKWRQYAVAKRWPLSWVYERESRLLLDYERSMAGQARAAVFVSEQEAALFRGLAPETAGRVTAIANGVDTDYFSPERVYANPYPAGARILVFTGAMDYWANVDAVTWFSNDILPAVRRAVGDCQFFIVGAKPGADVKALERLEGVTVTGAVPDVRPYLAHAAIVVAPMRIARGIQNKVLEGMAMARRVLVSPEAAEGIAAVAGRDFIVARDAGEMIEQAASLLRGSGGDLAQAARQCVLKTYHWRDKLARFEELLNVRPGEAAVCSPSPPASGVEVAP